jgi:hypothetical protein
MFWRDLLSIIRSLDTVFTAIGICHTVYVDCLLKLRCSASCWLLLHEYIMIHGPQNVIFEKKRCKNYPFTIITFVKMKM